MPEAKVRELLQKQSSLFLTEDAIKARVAARPTTVIGKGLKVIEDATGLPKSEVIEAATAI